MRNAVNRLLAVLVFTVITAAATWVAIEAAARLAGRHSHLLPLDYAQRWDELKQWNPSKLLETVIFVGIALAGLALVLFESWRQERRSDTVEVGRIDHGAVYLRAKTVPRFLRARLVERPWIRSASARLSLAGTRADVKATARTSRPWDLDELASARSGLHSDLERLGLTPGAIELVPRAPDHPEKPR